VKQRSLQDNLINKSEVHQSDLHFSAVELTSEKAIVSGSNLTNLLMFRTATAVMAYQKILLLPKLVKFEHNMR
jgi:hypothetical protein